MAQIEAMAQLVADYSGAAGADLVRRAYELCSASCTGVSVASPIPLLEQALAAAQDLAELENRAEGVAAALLVDLPPDDCPSKTIRRSVGKKVARLVDGVRQMRERPYLSSLDRHAWSERERTELYNAFVSSLKDPQVILIELAHQMSRLRNVDKLSPAQQNQAAAEVHQIYAPLASRLGIWRLKWELEDRAFLITNSEEYREIADALREDRAEREAAIENMGSALRQELEGMGIEAQIAGRPKHICSIYRKMRRKGVSLDAVYDVRALRVLVDSVPACYQALGAVHRLWTPIPGQFDDYVAAPKANGYQSLHTAVTDDQAQTLEVQIRTHEMHDLAELGIAAHWRYKERDGSRKRGRKKKELQAEQAINERISWLRSLLSEPEETPVALATVGLDGPQSEAASIFVFTPGGDLIRMPAGSTPVDFAYRIHTELGHRCSGAKVNGKIVPLKHQLATGDSVEISTRKRGGPNIAWLSLDRGFVRTRQAQKKISAWFRRQRRERNVVRGREVLERELAKLGKSSLSFEKVSALLRYDRTEEMLAQIGSGEIPPPRIGAAIAAQAKPSKEEQAREAEEELVTRADETKTLIERKPGAELAKAARAARGLQVASTDGLHYQIARCCNPLPPEEIVGYVTRGHGVTIHLAGCPNVNRSPEQERIIPASWGTSDGQTYPVMVVVEAHNRRGLMGDIGQAVAMENIDIGEAKVKKKAQWAMFELLLEVADAEQLGRVLEKLEQTKGVRGAYRKVG